MEFGLPCFSRAVIYPSFSKAERVSALREVLDWPAMEQNPPMAGAEKSPSMAPSITSDRHARVPGSYPHSLTALTLSQDASPAKIQFQNPISFSSKMPSYKDHIKEEGQSGGHPWRRASCSPRLVKLLATHSVLWFSTPSALSLHSKMSSQYLPQMKQCTADQHVDFEVIMSATSF